MSKEIENSKAFYNKIGFYLFIASIAFSSLWAGYFLIMNNHIDLGEQAIQTAEGEKQELSTPEKEERLWISSEDLIAHGSKVYQAQCAVCHGAEGLGDGTPGLIPPARNLVEGDWKQGGSSKALFLTLQQGIEGSSMVSFKHLPQRDRWALVHYIRSLTKNKVADNEEELEAFAKQNL